ncbi:MAG: DUF3267 domain-containing protein [Oscillospiraceae bacterium]|nr:DUF3267 domain-containing protein [Oscillospiraceae bacterium]
MPTCQVLPEGYSEYYSVDLQKDKKTATFVNVLSLVLSLAVGIPMHLSYPIWHLFEMEDGFGAYLARMLVFLVSLIAYLCLHELTHAAVMKYYGATKVRFGFTGLYAYAGSLEDYFGKLPYIHIALAPVVVWGIVFFLLAFLVKGPWLWVVYFLQIMNIGGAAGDLYVAAKFSRFPSDILVRDTGVDMTVFSREGRNVR